jgi:hypothetical protein
MNTLGQTFKKIEYYPRPSLASDIIKKIHEREVSLGKRRFWAFTILGNISLILVIPSVMLLITQASQSGFLNYLSLAGTSVLSSSVSELVSTILSTLPLTGIIAVLAALLGFAWSLRKAFVLPAPNLA